jgi:periplasmic protein TonB
LFTPSQLPVLPILQKRFQEAYYIYIVIITHYNICVTIYKPKTFCIMSKNNVFNNGWIDLVFEGRNKSYGAYQLRKQDSKTTMIALFSGIAFMATAAAIPAGINYFSGNDLADTTVPKEHIIEVTDDLFIQPKDPVVEPPKPEPVVQAAPAAPAPPATPTIQFREALVATSEPVPNPPSMKELEGKNPGPETTEGKPGGDPMSTSPGVEGGTGKNSESKEPEGATNVNMVDVMPLYPGGMEAFYREVGRKYRIPESEDLTTAKIYVSFIIEKDGTLSNVKVLRDPYPNLNLGKEALRVLNGMKAKWTPGIANGKPVRTAYNLPITVKIN